MRHERGAEIRTRTPVTAARREGELWTVETPAGSFTATRAGQCRRARRRTTWRSSRGSSPPTASAGCAARISSCRKLFDHPFAYIFQLPDTRICFAIPYEDDFTLIGTTDATTTAR